MRMSKNGWIACVIGVIVLLCAGVFCIGISLFGIIGYYQIAPSITLFAPFNPGSIGSPTSSPVVIRPTYTSSSSTPAKGDTSLLQQTAVATPFPVSTLGSAPVTTETLATLENTTLPINDPIELARRLLHYNIPVITEVPPATFYQAGAHESFWVGNGDVKYFLIRATLRYVTPHSYFWIEDNVPFDLRDLITLANTFENQIYPTDREFFGSEWTPGVDGDPHIYILYAKGLGDKIAGYFSSADEYPVGVNRYSNGHEMFMINADNSPLDDEYTFGVLAHELQHMIQWYQDRNESNWLSEGFSELAVMLNNYYSGGFDALYTSNPDLQLNDWPDDRSEDTTPHYGAGFLFLTYFLDRFGDAATKTLSSNPGNDFKSLDTTLQAIKAVDPQTGKPITTESFFQDWVITNYLMDSRVGDGRFNYIRYTGAPRAGPTESFRRCPVPTTTREVHQFGVDYIRFTCWGSYNLHFEGSIQTPLLSQDPHSGSYAMWANKDDESDTTLTRSFDLTNYSGALTLEYWTWYAIEDGWDYIYVEASTDGVNWKILNTPSGTGVNPQGNNYGWGYTGNSGGGKSAVWINERVDLSTYAGKKLILRFEYITDSNVTEEGFLLDDLSIPQIGYSTDFEADDGSWQANGWARIQNVLPQYYGLALLSFGKSTTVQYITLDPDITADIPFTIGNGVDTVVLVVSGTTRFTRQMAPYRFTVINQP
jgi:immune inhibitor A